MDNIPSLPFELQICILSQIPICQIFTLRRVSRAWHTMLSNPHLESALMDLYPFLTTAPTLTALAKRRLRILRGEPVAIIQRAHRIGLGGAVTLFSGGYDVLIRLSSRRFRVATPFSIQLIVKDMKQHGKLIVQADLLAVIQAEFPEIYASYVGDPREMNVGTRMTSKFLQIHDKTLMVGMEIDYTDGSNLLATGSLIFRSLCMVHILFFSLETGSVINSFAAPAPRGYKNSVLAAFNGTLFTIGWINSEDSPGTLALDTFLLQTKARLSTITTPNHHHEFPFHLDDVGNLYFPAEPSQEGTGWYKAPIDIKCISAETGDSRIGSRNIRLPVPSAAPNQASTRSRWRLILGAMPLNRNRVFAIQLPDIGAIEYQNFDSIPLLPRSAPVVARTTFCSDTPLVARHMTARISLPEKVFRKAIDRCVSGICVRPQGTNPERKHPLLWGRIFDSEAEIPWWTMLSDNTGCWGGKNLFNNRSKLGNIPIGKLGKWVEGDDGIDVFHLPIDFGDHRESEFKEWGVQALGPELNGSPQLIVCWDEDYTF